MEIAPEVTELEDLAAQSSVTISRALKAAGVSSTTHWRWKNAGAVPSTGTVRKVRAAIEELASRAA